MADLEIRLHSPGRLSADDRCPCCGEKITFSLEGQPPFLPSPVFVFECQNSGREMTAVIVGWALNPTGEIPAVDSEPAIHHLSRLERALAKGEH